MDDSRQRAREAAEREMHGWLSSGQRECIVNAIATYVHLERDERMRGEPDAPSRPVTSGPVAAGDPVVVHVAWANGAWWPGVIRATRDSVDGPFVAGEVFGPLGQISTWASLLSAEGTAWRRREDVALHARVAELETERVTLLRADVAFRNRIFELEAVVRAADELRKLGELTAQEAYEAGPGTHARWLGAPAKYDIARAKLEVPHG